ncbi:MAG: hypothetical protein OEW75_15025, partial [Cyclobacteriaceae bacterium]|nr:hypothetical protein [Cyclobacteriaceae bacterium]
GKLIRISDSVTRILGYQLYEIQDDQFWEIFYNFNKDTVLNKKNLNEFLKHQYHFTSPMEVLFMNKQMEETHYSIEISRLSSHRILCIATDITYLKRRNEDLNQFASILSQDMETPIKSINTLSELMLNDFIEKIPLELNWQFKEIRKRAKYMNDIVESLSYFSKTIDSKEEKRWINLNELFTGIVNQLSTTEIVRISVQPDLPLVYLHEPQLRLVLFHLLKEAIRYHRIKNGSLEVRYYIKENTPVLTLKSNANRRQLRTKATSCEEIIQYPFKKTAPDKSIGYLIVKKIIENDKCNLWVESNHSGTTYHLQFDPNSFNIVSKSIHNF